MSAGQGAVSAAQASILRKIAEAKQGVGRTPFINLGKYVFIVQRLQLKSGFKGNNFIIEFYVKSSMQIDPNIIPNHVDTSCSLVFNLDDVNGYGASNTKTFLIALLGEGPKCGPDDPTGVNEFIATIASATGEMNPCRGMEIGDETWIKKTKEKKLDFTNHNWKTIKLTEEEILLNCMLLDGKEKAAETTK